VRAARLAGERAGVVLAVASALAPALLALLTLLAVGLVPAPTPQGVSGAGAAGPGPFAGLERAAPALLLVALGPAAPGLVRPAGARGGVATRLPAPATPDRLVLRL
jgi:hypothetical protein